jgi:hypothetical protein
MHGLKPGDLGTFEGTKNNSLPKYTANCIIRAIDPTRKATALTITYYHPIDKLMVDEAFISIENFKPCNPPK